MSVNAANDVRLDSPEPTLSATSLLMHNASQSVSGSRPFLMGIDDEEKKQLLGLSEPAWNTVKACLQLFCGEQTQEQYQHRTGSPAAYSGRFQVDLLDDAPVVWKWIDGYLNTESFKVGAGLSTAGRRSLGKLTRLWRALCKLPTNAAAQPAADPYSTTNTNTNNMYPQSQTLSGFSQAAPYKNTAPYTTPGQLHSLFAQEIEEAAQEFHKRDAESRTWTEYLGQWTHTHVHERQITPSMNLRKWTTLNHGHLLRLMTDVQAECM